MGQGRHYPLNPQLCVPNGVFCGSAYPDAQQSLWRLLACLYLLTSVFTPPSLYCDKPYLHKQPQSTSLFNFEWLTFFSLAGRNHMSTDRRGWFHLKIKRQFHSTPRSMFICLTDVTCNIHPSPIHF